MQISAFRSIPRPGSQSAKPGARYAGSLVSQTFVQFSGGNLPKEPVKQSKSEPQQSERGGIDNKLFGSPLKNIGWAVAYGSAGGAALLMMPPLGMALFAASSLHIVAAIWQFIKHKKSDAPQADNQVETSPQTDNTKATEATKA